jgi:hypothetical protein
VSRAAVLLGHGRERPLVRRATHLVPRLPPQSVSAHAHEAVSCVGGGGIPLAGDRTSHRACEPGRARTPSTADGRPRTPTLCCSAAARGSASVVTAGVDPLAECVHCHSATRERTNSTMC